MYGLGSLSLFLAIAVFFSICTIGNSEVNNKSDQQCQGSVIKLKCDNKSYIMYIDNVFYGREMEGAKMCRSPSGSFLSDEIMCDTDVSVRVKEICQWKRSCNFTLNKETLGSDECSNVFKYMDVTYKCIDRHKGIRGIDEVKFVSLTPLVVMATSTVTSSPRAMASQVVTTEAIQPTSTLVANVERLSTIYQSQEATTTLRSSSLSSSRPHRVSVTTVSHTQRLSTSVAIETPSLQKTTKPASKTYEKSPTFADQHGTMKLFKFILSFHIIREEHIHKHTASSVVWFMFGLLVGLFIMIAILVYYRVKQARRERKNKPNKAEYFKQKDCSDGTLEEKVILHPKELEALEMESQLGETV